MSVIIKVNNESLPIVAGAVGLRNTKVKVSLLSSLNKSLIIEMLKSKLSITLPPGNCTMLSLLLEPNLKSPGIKVLSVLDLTNTLTLVAVLDPELILNLTFKIPFASETISVLLAKVITGISLSVILIELVVWKPILPLTGLVKRIATFSVASLAKSSFTLTCMVSKTSPYGLNTNGYEVKIE